jgi:HAD superfamily hydrolase (TIGR01509 family)
MKTAIVTGSDRSLVNQVCAVAGIDLAQFDRIICSNDVSKSKPDPEGYLKALDMLNANACDSIAIEDSDLGVMAGVNAGLKVVYIPDVRKNDENLIKKASWKLSSLDEVIEIVK